MPFGADNALIKAAEIVRRIAEYRPSAHIDAIWEAQVDAFGLPDEVRDAMKSSDKIWDTLKTLPPGMARTCHALTHTTFSPNVAHGGQKTNTIPDVIDIDVDIRTVPGTTKDDVEQHLRAALGDLYDHVEINVLQEFGGSDGVVRRPATPSGTLVDETHADRLPGRHLIPGSDRRWHRCPLLSRTRVVAYGAGLFSEMDHFATFGRGSTATTNVSTSSRSGCRRSTSTASPKTSSAEPFTSGPGADVSHSRPDRVQT